MRGMKILSTLIAVIFIASTVFAAPVEVNRLQLLGNTVVNKTENEATKGIAKEYFNELLARQNLASLMSDKAKAFDTIKNELNAQGVTALSALKEDEYVAVRSAFLGVLAALEQNNLTPEQINKIADQSVAEAKAWVKAVNQQWTPSQMFGPRDQDVINEVKNTVLPVVDTINGVQVLMDQDLYNDDIKTAITNFVATVDQNVVKSVSIHAGLAFGASLDGTNLILPQELVVNLNTNPRFEVVRANVALILSDGLPYVGKLATVDEVSKIFSYYYSHELLENSLPGKNGLSVVEHYNQVVIPHEAKFENGAAKGLWERLFFNATKGEFANVYSKLVTIDAYDNAMNEVKNSGIKVLVPSSVFSNPLISGTLLATTLKDVDIVVIDVSKSPEAIKTEIDLASKGAVGILALDLEKYAEKDKFLNAVKSADKKGLVATLENSLFEKTESFDPADFQVGLMQAFTDLIYKAKSAIDGQQLAVETFGAAWFLGLLNSGKIAESLLKAIDGIQKTMITQRVTSIAA